MLNPGRHPTTLKAEGAEKGLRDVSLSPNHFGGTFPLRRRIRARITSNRFPSVRNFRTSISICSCTLHMLRDVFPGRAPGAPAAPRPRRRRRDRGRREPVRHDTTIHEKLLAEAVGFCSERGREENADAGWPNEERRTATRNTVLYTVQRPYLAHQSTWTMSTRGP